MATLKPTRTALSIIPICYVCRGTKLSSERMSTQPHLPTEI